MTFSWSFPRPTCSQDGSCSKQFTTSSSNFLLYCSIESTEEQPTKGGSMTIMTTMKISPSLYIHYCIIPQSLPSCEIQSAYNFRLCIEYFYLKILFESLKDNETASYTSDFIIICSRTVHLLLLAVPLGFNGAWNYILHSSCL